MIDDSAHGKPSDFPLPLYVSFHAEHVTESTRSPVQANNDDGTCMTVGIHEVFLCIGK